MAHLVLEYFLVDNNLDTSTFASNPIGESSPSIHLQKEFKFILVF